MANYYRVFTISIWYPHYKALEREITILAGEALNLDYQLDAAIVRRPRYVSQGRFRMDPASPEEDFLHEGEELYIIDD